MAADPRLEQFFVDGYPAAVSICPVQPGATAPERRAVRPPPRKFLTQVGDYADSLSKHGGQGESIDSKHWETLNSLYQQSIGIEPGTAGYGVQGAQNNFYFGEMVRQIRNNLQKNPDNSGSDRFPGP